MSSIVVVFTSVLSSLLAHTPGAPHTILRCLYDTARVRLLSDMALAYATIPYGDCRDDGEVAVDENDDDDV